MSNQKRSLKFDNLDQIPDELNRLLETGYTQTGNWNLSQTCGHLHDWMRYEMDGYPQAALPIRVIVWLMKVTVGRRQLESTIKNGFKDNLPTMPETIPEPDAADDAAAVETLIATINRLKNTNDPIVPSPLFGPLTKQEAIDLQLVHCAHHLGFLIPN